jgi:ABC-type antimicrobial peptide transport system permease subunit
MIKSIFTQILNRKRSNTWIVLELILVFCLVWYISDYFFVLNYNYSLPNYRNIEHTWKVDIAEYPKGHPQYQVEANNGEALEANFARILQTIRNYPGVEAISIATGNSEPGNIHGSYRSGYYNADDSTRSVAAQYIYFESKEDFFRVFGYTTDNGKTPVSVGDFDWSTPNGVIIGRSVAEYLFNGSAIGKELSIGKKGEHFVILGVVDNIKRYNYERPQNAIYFPFRLDSTNIRNAVISIRSSSSLSDVSFQETFKKEMSNRLQTGNFYLKKMVSYSKIADNTKNQRGTANEIRIHTYLMIFFLLNILLCVMGTFWYRIHTRREEIGIRKAMGASSSNILNNLLTEGLCLLLIAMIPAMVIEFQFVHAGLIKTMGLPFGNQKNYLLLLDHTGLRFLITNSITWVVMAAVIVTAIWLPARKAAAMPAAEALHYE